jgi:uncharacterized protein DUF1569
VRSLWNEPDRQALLGRFDRLRPDARPEWGKMSAPQMLAHIGDSMRMAIGAVKVEPKRTPLRFTPIKQVVIYALPSTPRNLPTAPELRKTPPGVWSEDMRHVKELIRRAVLRYDQHATRWPDHPAFGKLSPRAWGVLIYKHLDHHLRQFAV